MVGTAGRLREDVVARFVVVSGKLLGRLSAPLCAKHTDMSAVEVDAPNGIQALACRGDDFVTDVGRELDDADHSGLEIDVWPPERDELADAKPRPHEEGPQRVGPVSLHEPEELPGLLGRPVPRDRAASLRAGRLCKRVDGDDPARERA